MDQFRTHGEEYNEDLERLNAEARVLEGWIGENFVKWGCFDKYQSSASGGTEGLSVWRALQRHRGITHSNLPARLFIVGSGIRAG